MEFRFRGITVFKYDSETQEVTQGEVHGIPAFNYCRFIDEDFELLSMFFKRVALHRTGSKIKLEDIVVN